MTHDFNDDGICKHCLFDGSEHHSYNNCLPLASRDPEQPCISTLDKKWNAFCIEHDAFFMDTTVVNMNTTDNYDVYIGRGSIWGNPFKIGRDGTPEEVVEKYIEWFIGQDKLHHNIEQLSGKILGCYCDHPQDCHGHFLAYMADHWGTYTGFYPRSFDEVMKSKPWRAYK